MRSKAHYRDQDTLRRSIAAARGETPADIVIKNTQFLDVFGGQFIRGDVAIFGDTIVGVGETYQGRTEVDGSDSYIVPGFIDAHVHIESSLMTPARFQEAVLPCGTTSVVWDPHEIANVKGTAGIEWALSASDGLDLDVFVMVPSCVPATTTELGFETSGAELRADAIRPFRSHDRVLGLAEMMNFPGLLHGDPDIMQKLTDFAEMRRDGHCPGLTGKDLNAYGVAGIHSCHESTELSEAREKLQKGIHVLIREGSCAKDADALLPLLNAYNSATLSLCSDDRNPADIAHEGHIDCIINKALRAQKPANEIFRAASFAPARLFGLDDRGAIAPGYKADMVMVKTNQPHRWASGITVQKVWKNGKLVDAKQLAEVAQKKSAMPAFSGKNLNLAAVTPAHFKVDSTQREQTVRVIEVIPRKIITNALQATLKTHQGDVLADLKQDILKIAVLERHHGTGQKSVAFVKGFHLQRGAIATSINHDSHNVITVGASDEAMAEAVNYLREVDGGIVVVDGKGQRLALPLPIGGLMTPASPQQVTETLIALKKMAADIGCQLEEPFLQLSFLALPVIPTLKITDRGLVDVSIFQKVPVCMETV